MHSPLSILSTIRSMKRDPHSCRIADYRDSLFARLKLFHFVNVRPVHRNTFRRSLLVLHTSLRVSNKAARSSGKLRDVTLSEMIHKLMKWILWQIQSRQTVDYLLLHSQRFLALYWIGASISNRHLDRFACS